mmetsp:Transcript_17707/g.43337  ORF Transcript_17707/g.43337 Transcript_17707/m.43337 type:complete len:233 (-) Transcript_17707:2331-3029(-)
MSLDVYLHRFHPPPRLVQDLVVRRSRVPLHQPIQRRHRRVGLPYSGPSHCRLPCCRLTTHRCRRRSWLHVQCLRSELLNLKRGKHEESPSPVWVRLHLDSLLSDLRKKLRSLWMPLCLAIQLNRFHLTPIFKQVRRVLGQQPLDLREVVLLRQTYRLVPLVQKHTTVDGLLHVPPPHKRLHSLLRQADRRELVSDCYKQRRALRQLLFRMRDEVDQAVVVLEIVEAVDQLCA